MPPGAGRTNRFNQGGGRQQVGRRNRFNQGGGGQYGGLGSMLANSLAGGPGTGTGRTVYPEQSPAINKFNSNGIRRGNRPIFNRPMHPAMRRRLGQQQFQDQDYGRWQQAQDQRQQPGNTVWAPEAQYQQNDWLAHEASQYSPGGPRDFIDRYGMPAPNQGGKGALRGQSQGVPGQTPAGPGLLAGPPSRPMPGGKGIPQGGGSPWDSPGQGIDQQPYTVPGQPGWGAPNGAPYDPASGLSPAPTQPAPTQGGKGAGGGWGTPPPGMTQGGKGGSRQPGQMGASMGSMMGMGPG